MIGFHRSWLFRFPFSSALVSRTRTRSRQYGNVCNRFSNQWKRFRYIDRNRDVLRAYKQPEIVFVSVGHQQESREGKKTRVVLTISLVRRTRPGNDLADFQHAHLVELRLGELIEDSTKTL